jgi:PIN domain nuclease of toxin-antitoxin system
VNLLLDTSVLIWWLTESPRLGREAISAIGAADSEIWISAASAWEIAVKARAGRPLYKQSPEKWFGPELERNRFRPLAITVQHALEVASLPLHHGDPFDRLLIAQARIESMVMVTADEKFESYGIPLIDATE